MATGGPGITAALQATVLAASKGNSPTAWFFVAIAAVVVLLVAIAVVLSPAGEPSVPRQGSVLRTLERREPSSDVEEDS